jgi:galactosyl transferase GMA12/MNN10 family
VSKVIASLGCGSQSLLLRLAARSFRPYAARHGYALELRTESLDSERPAPWSKIVLLRALAERYELLVWLDADLVIVDRSLDIASELEAGRFLYLVEHATKEGRMPNSGVMMLRGGAQTVEFLDEVYAQKDLIDHRWWENAAICRLLGYELDPVGPGAPTALLSEHTKLLSPRWNSIPDAPAQDPRIRHYPGYSLKARAALMARDLVLRGSPRRGWRATESR